MGAPAIQDAGFETRSVAGATNGLTFNPIAAFAASPSIFVSPGTSRMSGALAPSAAFNL